MDIAMNLKCSIGSIIGFDIFYNMPSICFLDHCVFVLMQLITAIFLKQYNFELILNINRAIYTSGYFLCKMEVIKVLRDMACAGGAARCNV